ncbi:MAG: fumarylacetoacetate hydrolase family protein [Deltaproteobacteria bacterium]|nr:fumarylacetoacetate hydrolase family protein [Deltaproteobacteria bacterium]
MNGTGGDAAPLGRRLGRASDLTLLSPVLPGKIIAIGLNYRDHIKEAKLHEPSSPLIFAKFPSSVTGPNDPICIDRTLTERVDWEVELGVVIGRKMRNVPLSEVFDYVLGYTAVNDVSARDVQFGDGQWTRGKSFDTFCPIGPGIVTPEEITDPQSLSLRTYLNGETVQDSSTSEMLFPIAELLSYCSRCFTLEPGDIILTGTPWGCGEFMTPRRSLKPGDLIEVEIEAIGRLSNPVVAAE